MSTKYLMDEDTSPRWSTRVPSGDEIIWVDVEKIRSSWSRDGSFYFDSSEHPNAIKGRIERFGEWIKQGEPVNPPEISLSPNGIIFFTNGRHRFVWMMQHGITSMPVAVPSEEVREITERFGIDS